MNLLKKYDVYASIKTTCSVFVILSYYVNVHCNFDNTYRSEMVVYCSTNILYTLWRWFFGINEIHFPLQFSFVAGAVCIVINFNYLIEDIKDNMLLIWCSVNLFLELMFLIVFLKKCCKESQIEYERRLELEGIED